MKEEKIPLYVLCFFGLMAAAYLEVCAVVAFQWAGFNGYGGITMEYDQRGETAFCIVLYAPLLLLVFILVLRMLIHYKQKVAVKYYFCDLFFCASAIGMAIFICCFFKEPGQTIIDSIMLAIREIGWLHFPIP